MLEFMIKRTDGQWFDIPDQAWEGLYLPHSVPAEYVPGHGVPAIRVLGCGVTFSQEEPGSQVSFVRGSADETAARQVVDEILENIIRATGQAGEVVQISR